MNNVSTVITGNVAVDTTLQQRLATDDVGKVSKRKSSEFVVPPGGDTPNFAP
jgi:hypothetical protein